MPHNVIRRAILAIARYDCEDAISILQVGDANKPDRTAKQYCRGASITASEDTPLHSFHTLDLYAYTRVRACGILTT